MIILSLYHFYVIFYFKEIIMVNKVNSNRFLLSGDNPDGVKLLYDIRNFALKYGIEEVQSCFAQAIVDLVEKKFMNSHNISLHINPVDDIAFIGDHKKAYSGKNGIIFRADEYAMTFGEIIKRLQLFLKCGYDGYITGQSVHFSSVTFGIVVYKKSTYSKSSGL
jgi:hypothetical protein